MNNNLLPLIFVSNKDFLNHLIVSIFSLAKNNLDVHINFYIINNDITKTDLKKIERSIHFHKSFTIINCKSDNKTLSKIKLKVGHINEIAFLKFLIGDFVKEDKALYIDSDTIILKSLKPLIAINLNEFCIGAVEEDSYNNAMRDRVGIKKNIKTFNSGVLLIDLKKWKKFKIKQKCLEHLQKYKNNLYYLDQDSLNSVISGKFKSLDSTYNQIQAPTIVHFAGNKKHWSSASKHTYKNHYW